MDGWFLHSISFIAISTLLFLSQMKKKEHFRCLRINEWILFFLFFFCSAPHKYHSHQCICKIMFSSKKKEKQKRVSFTGSKHVFFDIQYLDYLQIWFQITKISCCCHPILVIYIIMRLSDFVSVILNYNKILKLMFQDSRILLFFFLPFFIYSMQFLPLSNNLEL